MTDWGGIMGFERIIPMYVQGTSFMGQNLDALYSEKIDEAGLKQWAETLADCVEYFGNNEDGGQAIPFRYVFFFELVDFCLFIAASDGSITPEEVKAIDWLTSGERSLDLEKAMELRTEAEEQCLMRRYPYSFRILVEEVAGGNEDGIMEAGVISRFYLQVARFVHSIDNPGDFDENNPAYLYVSSFDKYVERVSADDFFIPFEEDGGRFLRNVESPFGQCKSPRVFRPRHKNGRERLYVRKEVVPHCERAPALVC